MKVYEDSARREELLEMENKVIRIVVKPNS